MAKPFESLAAGGVRVAIWEHEIQVDGSSKTVLKASIERRCRDKSGAWESSTSFSRNEIPLAIYSLEKAEVQRGRGGAA